MFIFIAIIHVIVSLVLIAFVLLQNPKGGALGIMGGGSGAKSVFSGTGASDFLVTITKWCAVIFALTSIQLAYMNTKKGTSSVILNQESEINPQQEDSEKSQAPENKSSSEKKPEKQN